MMLQNIKVLALFDFTARNNFEQDFPWLLGQNDIFWLLILPLFWVVASLIA
jgi:hypothetical protein